MILSKKIVFIKISAAGAVGLLTGILTVVGQKYLPGSLNSLANSGAVWLIPAFFIAVWAKNPVPSILLCIETLIVCVVSYYMFEAVMNSHGFDFFGYYFYLWLCCAAAFGTVFGFGASLFARKKRYYHWGAVLLPAVFISEGVIELIHLSDYAHMIPAVIGRIIIGTGLYFIIIRKDSFNRKPLAALFVFTVLGTAGFELIYKVT